MKSITFLILLSLSTISFAQEKESEDSIVRQKCLKEVEAIMEKVETLPDGIGSELNFRNGVFTGAAGTTASAVESILINYCKLY